jgi:hypothetical protein
VHGSVANVPLNVIPTSLKAILIFSIAFWALDWNAATSEAKQSTLEKV